MSKKKLQVVVWRGASCMFGRFLCAHYSPPKQLSLESWTDQALIFECPNFPFFFLLQIDIVGYLQLANVMTSPHAIIVLNTLFKSSLLSSTLITNASSRSYYKPSSRLYNSSSSSFHSEKPFRHFFPLFPFCSLHRSRIADSLLQYNSA